MLVNKKKKVDKSKIVTESEPMEKRSLKPALIIHGAASTKIGFGGEKFPRIVYPEQSMDLNARIKRFPIKGSEIINEDLLKAYWDASIKQLKIDAVENPLLISLPTANLTTCPFREFVHKHFFEDLEAEKVIVVSDPFLSLVGFLPLIKKLTAIIVDIGFSQIRIVPFYEATIIEEHITQVSFGGFDLTLQLATWLMKLGYDGPIDSLFIRDIKENYCYVRQHNQVISESKDKTISYHYGKNVFELSAERWKLPELLFYKKYFSEKIDFSPRSDYEGNRFDMKEVSLSQAIINVIKSLNFSLWKEMCNNICLTGGGAKFIGLKSRLEAELKEFFPEHKEDIHIHSSNEPSLLPYFGASKLAVLKSFQEFWQSKEDYETGEYDLFL
ncbi:MAG: hypothetical protein JXA54_08105 [Candidatus Heimdallarchaeota archaeon]|nr:hypothetical protein [Candidatus Heimdallarchaeota archaeon]